VHTKCFFVLVVWDCLGIIRMPPALFAYFRGTLGSIKFYFYYKFVTFLIFLGGSIAGFVLLMQRIKKVKNINNLEE
jgi:hypothetical protein